MSSTPNIVSVPSFRDYRAARRQQLRNSIAQYWKRVRARYELSNLGLADLSEIGVARAEVRQKSPRLLRRR
jgi:uncharacterized protein YjiS (DUF1127 family)